MSNALLDAALEYREAGLHPIPCAPRGKRPLVPWKAFQDVMPFEGQLRDWWTQWPDANIALVLGRGMFAVDVDGAEGGAALLAAGVEWGTDVPCSITSKGFHLFFAGNVPDRVGLLPKVDIRGVGYVIAPPSVHETGHVYAWEHPLNTGLPRPPAALLALLNAPKPMVERGGGDWLVTALEGVGEGGRDQTCTRLAGYLLGKGLPVEAVEVLLQSWADRCTPPFPSDQVTKCVTSIAKREGEHAAGPPCTLDKALELTLDEILTPPAQRRKPMATDLGGLDGLLGGGFYPGDYVILAARPTIGKTALALQIARKRAQAGAGVLFVSREMTRAALTRRLLAQVSGVNAKSLKTGELIDLERAALKHGAAQLQGKPMWIATETRTTEQLGDLVRTFDPGQLDLVIVDYLQLMAPGRDIQDARQRVEAVSRDIRALSLEHELPFLVLCSLSRPPKDRPSWEPSLSDLRESGALEHDADVVVLMHRADGADTTGLHAAKNRDGETGRLQLTFKANTLTFAEGV